MDYYFNEEASQNLEERLGFERGIPSEFDELFSELKEEHALQLEEEGNGVVRTLEDDETYILFELRNNPFEEYFALSGKYNAEEFCFEQCTEYGLKHIQDTAKTVFIDDVGERDLVEIKERIIDDEYDSKMVEAENISSYPIH